MNNSTKNNNFFKEDGDNDAATAVIRMKSGRRKMGYDFNMDEIFEMAEQIEKNGAKFYREAADRIAEPPNKDLLIKLAEMEDQHQKTFAFLRTQLSEGEKAPAVFDPNGEAALYLRALADIRVFFEKEIDVTSMEKILIPVWLLVL